MQIIGSFFTSPYFTYGSSAAILICPFFLKKYGGATLQGFTVSLGILGTFLGIFGGLVLFDTQNINTSIPILLGGLKTAFLTSISGSIAALTLKMSPQLYGLGNDEETDGGEDEFMRIRLQLENISKGLTGDEETSLVTQIQKLRTSLGDKQDELTKSFKEFAARMIEDNRTSLIKALEAVIKDFNAKINEQFGENFKHLNEGVGKMLEWQQNYTKQVESAVVALESSRQALEASADVMKSTATNAEESKRIAEELKKQLEAMGASMTGIKSLAESLKGSGQEIRNEMEEITKRSIQTLGENLAGISEKIVEDYRQLQEVIRTITRGR